MIIASSAMGTVWCHCTTRNSAIVTDSLSATGSRNSPNDEYRPQRRATQPSAMSVSAPSTNTAVAMTLLHFAPQ